jgi:hypothetical protein
LSLGLPIGGAGTPPFLAIALLLVPFVKKPTRQQFGPVAAISIFLGGLTFGLFYVGLGRSARPSPALGQIVTVVDVLRRPSRRRPPARAGSFFGPSRHLLRLPPNFSLPVRIAG